MSYTLTQQNNQFIALYGLIDGKTAKLGDGVTPNPNPTYINSATGTVKVKNAAGIDQVIGAAGATTSSAVYLASSNGDYTFLITSDFNSPTGSGYTIVVDLAAAGGFVGHWEFDAIVKVRKTLAP
jgi:hypothetical protein